MNGEVKIDDMVWVVDGISTGLPVGLWDRVIYVRSDTKVFETIKGCFDSSWIKEGYIIVVRKSYAAPRVGDYLYNKAEARLEIVQTSEHVNWKCTTPCGEYNIVDFITDETVEVYTPIDDVRLMYTHQGHLNYKCGETEVRKAGRNKDGEEQLVIKYSDSKQTTACIKMKDVPALAAALLEFIPAGAS